MVGLIETLAEGLEVPFRAFWCKARGGGGRLRQATEAGKKEKRRYKLVVSLIYILSHI